VTIVATAVEPEVQRLDFAPVLDRPEDPLVESLVERLHAQYGTAPDEIRSKAGELLRALDGARVRAFVPILVEKALREHCRGRALVP
jgi:hypothetical protein